MGEQSAIEWTDATWNPWQGCTKVSPACTHCYMFTDMKRYGKDGSVVHRSASDTFNLPLRSRKDGSPRLPHGFKVFTCSWSDWFHERADEWRDEAWGIVRRRPDLTFQIVTKRTERIAECLPSDWGAGYDNVWLIATVENQEWANRRVPELLAAPAKVRGLSIEPLLGPIDLRNIRRSFARGEHFGDALTGVDFQQRPPLHSTAAPRIDWVIVGGESGPHARPMHPAWVRSLRDQCFDAGVPFFFKQWGEFGAGSVNDCTGEPVFRQFANHQHWVNKASAWVNGGVCLDATGRELKRGLDFESASYPVTIMHRLGKKKTGRLLDGREWSQFPGEEAA